MGLYGRFLWPIQKSERTVNKRKNKINAVKSDRKNIKIITNNDFQNEVKN